MGFEPTNSRYFSTPRPLNPVLYRFATELSNGLRAMGAQTGWYLRHSDGVVHGPYRLQDLTEAAASGNIVSGTEVRHNEHTGGKWIPASRVRPVAKAMSNRATVTSPEAPPVVEQRAVDDDASPSIEQLRIHSKDSRRRPPMVVPKTLGAAFLATFDFRFRYYVTPWIIRILWVVFVTTTLASILLATIGLFAGPILDSIVRKASENIVRNNDGYEVKDSFRNVEEPDVVWNRTGPAIRSEAQDQSASKFVGATLFRIFGFLILLGFSAAWLLGIRLILETAIVLFRIAEDLTDLKDAARRFQPDG